MVKGRGFGPYRPPVRPALMRPKGRNGNKTLENVMSNTNLTPVQKDALKFDELMVQLIEIDLADKFKGYTSFEEMSDRHIIVSAMYKWCLFHDGGTMYWEEKESDCKHERAFYRKCIRQGRAFLKKHCPEAVENPNMYRSLTNPYGE